MTATLITSAPAFLYGHMDKVSEVFMFFLEIRALIHQCVRLGTFFYLEAEEANGLVSTGRDEYHLSVEFEPGERMAALGRVCIIQFDAACLGRTDHGVLPPVAILGLLKSLRLRTNHVQTPHDIARSVYLWVHDNVKGRVIRLDDKHVNLLPLESGQFLIELEQK